MVKFDDKDINDSTQLPTISPDNEPSRFDELRAQPWFGRVARIVVAVIIILVIVFGGRWLHHKLSSNAVKPAPANTKELPAAPFTSNKKSSNNGSKASSSNSSKSNGSQKSSTPQEITNTGPGDVLAIFVAASFVAASLHYVVTLRKES